MNRVMTGAIVFVSIVALTHVSMSRAGHVGPNAAGHEQLDTGKDRDAFDLLVDQVVSQLCDEALWHNLSRTKELRQAIELAGRMRCIGAIGPLVDNLEYKESGSFRTPLGYPAEEALVKIGLPAVPHLIAVIKTDRTEFEKLRERPIPGASYFPLERDHAAVSALAARTIVKIYGGDKLGAQMAALRLRDELKGATGEVKAQLQAAVDFVAKEAGPVGPEAAGHEKPDAGEERDAFDLLVEQVVRQLHDEALWHNVSRTKELEQAIELAGRMRCVKAIGPFVDNIEYTTPRAMDSFAPLHAKDALVKIGLPAVPHLIAVIKADKAEFEKERERPIPGASYFPLPRDYVQVSSIAARTLVEIYGGDKLGAQMAELRLREALNGATGEGKAQLQAAVELVAKQAE